MASIVYAMETLQVFRENSVVTVTINQPEKKNAINSAMWDGLTEIFHEIAGPDSQYFPAGDPKAFAAEISKLRNESTWMQARQDSLKNARRFSWQQSADELLRFIDRL